MRVSGSRSKSASMPIPLRAPQVVSPSTSRWDSEKARRLSFCLTVSGVSPDLRLIEKYRGKMQERALVGAKAPALRQVGRTQSTQVVRVRQQG
jgi:hypothetical protein